MKIITANKSEIVVGYIHYPAISGFGHAAQSIVDDNGVTKLVPPYDLLRSLNGVLPIAVPASQLGNYAQVNSHVASDLNFGKPLAWAHSHKDDYETLTSFDVLSRLFSGAMPHPTTIVGENHGRHIKMPGTVMAKGSDSSVQPNTVYSYGYDAVILKYNALKVATAIQLNTVLVDGNPFIDGIITLSGVTNNLHRLDYFFHDYPVQIAKSYAVAGYTHYKVNIVGFQYTALGSSGAKIEYTVKTDIRATNGTTYYNEWDCTQTLNYSWTPSGYHIPTSPTIEPFTATRFYTWDHTVSLLNGNPANTGGQFTKTVSLVMPIYPVTTTIGNDHYTPSYQFNLELVESVSRPFMGPQTVMTTKGTLHRRLQSVNGLLADQLNSMVGLSTASAVRNAIQPVKTSLFETVAEYDSAMNLFVESPPILKAFRALRGTPFTEYMIARHNIGSFSWNDDGDIVRTLKTHMISSAVHNSGGIPGLPWKKVRTLTKGALKTFLWFQFGVVPLITLLDESDDILGIFNSIGLGKKGVAHGMCTAESEFLSTAEWNVSEITVRTKLVYETSPGSLFAGALPFSQTGLTDIAGNLWKIFPWSWLISSFDQRISQTLASSHQWFQAYLLGPRFFVHTAKMKGRVTSAFLDRLGVVPIDASGDSITWFSRTPQSTNSHYNGSLPHGVKTRIPESIVASGAYIGLQLL